MRPSAVQRPRTVPALMCEPPVSVLRRPAIPRARWPVESERQGALGKMSMEMTQEASTAAPCEPAGMFPGPAPKGPPQEVSWQVAWLRPAWLRRRMLRRVTPSRQWTMPQAQGAEKSGARRRLADEKPPADAPVEQWMERPPGERPFVERPCGERLRAGWSPAECRVARGERRTVLPGSPLPRCRRTYCNVLSDRPIHCRLETWRGSADM